MTIHLCHTVFGNDKKRLSQIKKGQFIKPLKYQLPKFQNNPNMNG